MRKETYSQMRKSKARKVLARIIFLFFILFYSSTLLFSSSSVKATSYDPPWWDYHYLYRQEINVSWPSSGITQYTANLILNSSNTGGNFSFTSDRTSLRIVSYNSSSNSSTEIGHYSADWSAANQNATVQILIPYLVNSGASRIFLYYKYPSGTSSETYCAPYIYCDQFEDASINASLSSVDNDANSGTAFSEGSGVLSLTAGGSDTWTGADEYSSVFLNNIAGDVEVLLTAVSQTNSNSWAKAGIMFKNDMTSAGSSTGYIFNVRRPVDGYAMQTDENNNGYLETNSNGGNPSANPSYLRVIKSGTTFRGDYSKTGYSGWTNLGGTRTISSTNSIQDIGISLTSHGGATLCTATFDNFIVKRYSTSSPSAYTYGTEEKLEGIYIILDSPLNGTNFSSANLPINVSLTETGNLSYSIDGGSFITACTNCDNYTATLVFSSGVHNISFYAIDVLSGNSSSQTSEFFVDAENPIITLISPNTSQSTSDLSVQFTFQVNDSSAINSCSLYIENMLVATMNSPSKNTNLSFVTTMCSKTSDWFISCTDAFNKTTNSSTLQILSKFLAPWWNTSFLSRKEIILHSDLTSSLSNYPVYLDIEKTAQMQSDFSDLRFVHYENQTNTTTPLSYFIISSNSSHARIWLNVTTITSQNETVLYLYYENDSTVSPLSSAASVFFSNQIWLNSFSWPYPSVADYAYSHQDFEDALALNPSIFGNGTATQIYETSNPYGSDDMFFLQYRLLFLANESGTTYFGTDSDDASEIILKTDDDRNYSSTIASWYGAHGTVGNYNTYSGSFSTVSGNGYWVEYRMQENAGGQAADMGVRLPSAGTYSRASTTNFPNTFYYREYREGSEPHMLCVGDEESQNNPPTLSLLSPLNASKIVQNSTVTFLWNISDESTNLTCRFFLDSVLNNTFNCTTGNNSFSLDLDRGVHNWTIEASDEQNESTNSSTYSFTLIYDSALHFEKELKNINTNQLIVTLNITNLLNNISTNATVHDFVALNFSDGSHTPMYDSTFDIYGPFFFGTIREWNVSLSLSGNTSLNYSSAGISDYHASDLFMFGGD